MSANDKQVGGDHYKTGGEEHWDRAWRLSYDPFQYIITKWVERWREKGGVEDLKKAQHAIEKYLELVSHDLSECNCPARDNGTSVVHYPSCPAWRTFKDEGAEPDGRYTNQD